MLSSSTSFVVESTFSPEHDSNIREKLDLISGKTMELRQLKHFLAVAEYRQFGRAADAMNLSQQALSHSVAMLEASLQVKLFERGKFGAELTEMGRLFEKRARLVCGELDFAVSELLALKAGGDGHIRLGVSLNFASRVLPEAVLLFARARPNIRLSVVVATSKKLFDDLNAGKLEFALTSPIAGIEDHPDLEHVQLAGSYGHDPSVLVVAPDHVLATGPVEIKDLGGFRWCMPDSFTKPWEEVFGLMHRLGAEGPKYVVRTDSLTFAKSLIMKSDFISLLGYESVDVEIAAGLLVARPIPLQTKPAIAYATHRKGRPLPPAANVLINCFERAIAKTRTSPSEPIAQLALKEAQGM